MPSLSIKYVLVQIMVCSLKLKSLNDTSVCGIGTVLIEWYVMYRLTHWGRETPICVSKLTIIGIDNGLSPGRPHAIIWINAGILSIRTLGTNFSEILSEIHSFSFKKIPLKMSSGKWRPFYLGPNVLTTVISLTLSNRLTVCAFVCTRVSIGKCIMCTCNTCITIDTVSSHTGCTTAQGFER